MLAPERHGILRELLVSCVISRVYGAMLGSMKLIIQTWSATSLRPTFWPAKTLLKLIFRRPKHARPQPATVTVMSRKR